MSRQHVHYYLKKLEKAGLVKHLGPRARVLGILLIIGGVLILGFVLARVILKLFGSGS
jgi:ABC-type transport system involved in cytochrome c biogenesis permease subunit